MILKVIVDSLKFSFSAKRNVPYFLMTFLFLYTSCQMLVSLNSFLAGEPPTFIFNLYLFIFFLYFLFQPFFISFLLHQVRYFDKKIPIVKSFQFSLSIFLKSFLIFIIFGCVNFLLGLIPFLGIIFILIFSIITIYVYPAAIIDNKKILDSFKKSFSLFKKFPLKTMLFFIFVCLFSASVIFVSSLPILIWIGSKLYEVYTQTQDMFFVVNSLINLLSSIQILPFLALISLSSSFIFVFSFSAFARFYLQLKKKV
ncbi:MAG: hypothetical protein QW228_02740 [Candidatus Aenigmatarchaeota archaeon]